MGLDPSYIQLCFGCDLDHRLDSGYKMKHLYFPIYIMPRRRSVLSNCICFVYFITYFVLGHSQGPKGYHYYYNCDNNCCKTKPGQEG